ncbi:transposable element Tcb2 transposase [Trichonephila clavipes]|nr:transposable element Tcb2 transposase [Trichonephila clavipes]
MSNHQHLDDGISSRIVGRPETGQCLVQIDREFDLTPSVVCNLWKLFQDTGPIERKPGQSRPRATTAREDRHLLIIARRNRGDSFSALSLLRSPELTNMVANVTKIVVKLVAKLVPKYDANLALSPKSRQVPIDVTSCYPFPSLFTKSLRLSPYPATEMKDDTHQKQ